MSDPGLPEVPPPPEPPAAPLAEPPPERFPFWSYGDLCLFLGCSLPCLLAGALLVKIFLVVSRVAVRSEVLKLLPAQFLGYLFLFLFLYLLFKIEYGRPFWRSLRWLRAGPSDAALVSLGVLAAFGVGFGSILLKTPEVATPMSKLLTDRTSIILLAAFGITLGPLCEELIFRGFMQPLFVKSLGAAPGILLAAVPFGLLHQQQYGCSWRHGLLITLAGAAFGWMRHRSGSTRASAVMHAAYNAAFFVALLAQRK